MMLEMNYLQKPEEKQDPEQKNLKKAEWTGAKEEEEEDFFFGQRNGSASPGSGKSRLRRIPDKFTFPSVLHQIN